MQRIAFSGRIKGGHFNGFGFFTEEGRYGHPGLLMCICIHKGIGGMIVIVATPFKVREKSGMVIAEMFYRHAAVFGGVRGNDKESAHGFVDE